MPSAALQHLPLLLPREAAHRTAVRGRVCACARGKWPLPKGVPESAPDTVDAIEGALKAKNAAAAAAEAPSAIHDCCRRDLNGGMYKVHCSFANASSVCTSEMIHGVC